MYGFQTDNKKPEEKLQYITHLQLFLTGNGELLELRLLETGFLSRFQLNP